MLHVTAENIHLYAFEKEQKKRTKLINVQHFYMVSVYFAQRVRNQAPGLALIAMIQAPSSLWPTNIFDERNAEICISLINIVVSDGSSHDRKLVSCLMKCLMESFWKMTQIQRTSLKFYVVDSEIASFGNINWHDLCFALLCFGLLLFAFVCF